MDSQQPPFQPIIAVAQPAADKAVWRLQDRIEAGALTADEVRLLSRMVGDIGALGDAESSYRAVAHWAHIRGLFAELITETES